jgi:hypothetical protein
MRFLEKQLEDPVRFRRLKRWFYASLALVAVGEFVLPRVVGADEAHFRFENIPAWGSAFGFIACIAIRVASKLLGKLWLTRSENYYDS